MRAFLFSHFQVTKVKLINEKNSLNISFKMTWTVSFYFVFSSMRTSTRQPNTFTSFYCMTTYFQNSFLPCHMTVEQT